jgi:hypothetical protein
VELGRPPHASAEHGAHWQPSPRLAPRASRVNPLPSGARRRSEFGESKLTMKQNLLYVLHLAHLYLHAYPAAVGAAIVCAFAALALALDFALKSTKGGSGSGR